MIQRSKDCHNDLVISAGGNKQTTIESIITVVPRLLAFCKNICKPDYIKSLA